MAQYQLTIDIDNAGLTKIYNAGQSVTIVKSVVSSITQAGNLPIAWVQFQPMDSNIVTWQEIYNIFASTTILQSGAQISMSSQTPTPVQTGWTYTLANGQFAGLAGGSTLTYNANNQMNNYSYSFGLAQQAIVNNVPVFAPLTAAPVLYNEGVTFTPFETISIFLASTVNNGVVLSQIASNALTVTLSSQNPAAVIGFNDSLNTFYQQQSAMASPRSFAMRNLRVVNA
jgi:hypothetical protein